MPFIKTEEVKVIREAIKKEFPEFKFSIRKEHHSSVIVSVMRGPLDLGSEHQQINHYYIERFYEDEPEKRDFLLKVKEIILSAKPQHELVYDSDYGSVPNFYYNIHIGKWNLPYKIKESK